VRADDEQRGAERLGHRHHIVGRISSGDADLDGRRARNFGAGGRDEGAELGLRWKRGDFVTTDAGQRLRAERALRGRAALRAAVRLRHW
jgi:hypothetical protein